MTLEKSNMKKICSFCVSDWHIATTILPYIKERTENDEKVISIFEKSIENKINEIVRRMGIDKTIKNKIAGINWEAKNWDRYEQFEYFMEGNYSKSINVIINGNEKYLDKINSYLDKWYEKNDVRIKNENVNFKVVCCYNFDDVKQKNILPKFNFVLNTAGEKRVCDLLNCNSKVAI